MNKFTILLENKLKKYEISASIKLEVLSSSEGEAGYMSDSILASVNEQTFFMIDDIKEVFTDSNSYLESITEPNVIEIKKLWIAEFGDRTPNIADKLEFYYQIRNTGYSKEDIIAALKDKISKDWIMKK